MDYKTYLELTEEVVLEKENVDTFIPLNGMTQTIRLRCIWFDSQVYSNKYAYIYAPQIKHCHTDDLYMEGCFLCKTTFDMNYGLYAVKVVLKSERTSRKMKYYNDVIFRNIMNYWLTQ